ncbi:hypothetical protein ACIA58_18880 [Kribbella sp. NPDC051586]|uniref:hypothetical protein n=1 Tax=Kribbella sp. NPDC051586 TaxID=3364118 RepID=UPI0037A25D83
MSKPDDEQDQPCFVDVSIVEFAAHVAYLDPLTGTGYLVAPRAECDVEALVDPLVEAAWSERLNDFADTRRLSLHAADRRRALSCLAETGWSLLRDEAGQVEIAGRTAEGRQALCIYGPAIVEEPTLEALDRAVIALDVAAALTVHTSSSDDTLDPWWN